MQIIPALALGLSLFSASGSAQTPPDQAPAMFDVQIRLFQGDRLVATPRIMMREGATSTMTVDRPGGYSMRVHLARAGSTAAGVDRYLLSSQVQFERDGRWVLAATPTILMPLGQEARMEVASAAGDRFAMAVTVSPGDR